MRVAFDIDDTITRCPEFFAAITGALMSSGHKVYIITYREDRDFAEQDLAEHGIVFDQLILPPEAELHRRDADNWKRMAAQWKAEVCRRLGIDVLFNDMPDVLNAIGKDTVAFMAINPSLGEVYYRSTKGGTDPAGGSYVERS